MSERVIEIPQKNIERLFDFISKTGDKWPPYPDETKVILEEIFGEFWQKVDYSNKNSIYVLFGNQSVININRGKFNSLVLPKKRKRGVHYSKRTQRICQFISRGIRGKVIFDGSYGALKKGEVRAGEVHRFKIVGFNRKLREVYGVPLRHVFDRTNILYNLINCNYQIK